MLLRSVDARCWSGVDALRLNITTAARLLRGCSSDGSGDDNDDSDDSNAARRDNDNRR